MGVDGFLRLFVIYSRMEETGGLDMFVIDEAARDKNMHQDTEVSEQTADNSGAADGRQEGEEDDEKDGRCTAAKTQAEE